MPGEHCPGRGSTIEVDCVLLAPQASHLIRTGYGWGTSSEWDGLHRKGLLARAGPVRGNLSRVSKA